ncbi:EthD family reductase [Beijerinckia sp. L45]|uniref:EthD family reductase n=1 Tax=Beijerinckia sp. L45 TaxID=1641855 RepID=UPI00131E4A74|nr:EthD family reductase [Beijerinckia sp. L45]
MSKLVVLYDKPTDTAAFEKHFRAVHMPLVEKMPGLRGYSYGPATGLDESPGAYFWSFIGTFDSRQAILDAFGTAEGQAVAADIPNYSPDAPTILFVDSTESAAS